MLEEEPDPAQRLIVFAICLVVLVLAVVVFGVLMLVVK